MGDSGLDALIIHAHSEPDSFVAAMRDVVADSLNAHHARVVVSDLYAMNFNPILSPADFGSRRNSHHLTYALEQRHNFEAGTLASDIVVEIEKVLAADLLVFTFPVFWFSVPAILKGWIDRVFISGPFYGGRRIYGSGGLKGKKALAVFSMGGREHMFGANAIHGELQHGLLRHFLQGTLGYVGLQVLEPFVAWHVPYVTAEARAAKLEDLRKHVENIDALPALELPDLGAFDANFVPLAGDRDGIDRHHRSEEE